MLFQIENRLVKLQEAYAKRVPPKLAVVKSVPVENKKTEVILPPPLPLPVEEITKVSLPSEKTIAVAFPVSTHARIDFAMKKLNFKGSKREFAYLVLESALDVLAPQK